MRGEEALWVAVITQAMMDALSRSKQAEAIYHKHEAIRWLTSIITSEQHWCGIHLRWLYTLRHGAPGVRAVDPTHLGGIDTKTDDPEWREAREREYQDAMALLHREGCNPLITSLCIYNERPRFLQPSPRVTARRTREITQEIARLQGGFDALMRLWADYGRKK